MDSDSIDELVTSSRRELMFMKIHQNKPKVQLTVNLQEHSGYALLPPDQNYNDKPALFQFAFSTFVSFWVCLKNFP